MALRLSEGLGRTVASPVEYCLSEQRYGNRHSPGAARLTGANEYGEDALFSVTGVELPGYRLCVDDLVADVLERDVYELALPPAVNL